MDQRHSEAAEIEQLWSSLRDELRRNGADAQTAEDIAQDTWLVALQRPPEERGRFHGWLHVVAIRLWRRTRAREGERWRRELPAARSERIDLELASQADDGRDSLLCRHVDGLPEPYRTTLRLRFFEGLEIAEIALRLSIPRATVHTRVRRGLLRLRARIGARPEERGRQWSALAWLAGLRARLAEAPLQLLGGAGLAALGILSIWRFADTPRHKVALVAPPAEESVALADEEGAPLAVPSGPSAPDRQAASPRPAPRPGARLSGIVRTPDGEPLAGALVHVADADGSGAERTSASDERGRYEIAPGGELVWATHAEWCESPRTYVASIRERSDTELVLARTRGRAQVEVVTAAGLPVAGARVLVDASRKSQQATSLQGTLEFRVPLPGATTDAQGRCALVFPEHAETELLVLAEGHPGWRGSVSTPAAGGSLRIELSTSATLVGTCLDEAGQPLWRAQVEVVQLAGLVRRETRTDSEGAFRIEGLAPGDFLVRAREAGPGRISARCADRLEPGEERRLALELSEPGSIVGRVVAAGGPVAGARVELQSANASPAEGGWRTELSDEQGRFAFGGCDRNMAHELQVFLPGAREACLAVGQLRPGRGEASYCVPSPDTALAPIELELSGADGPVLVELRRDLPALSAILEPDEPGSGLFRSAALPAGTYRVLAWHPVLGTWQAATLEHEPRAPRVHPLAWPSAATLAIELELPEGVRPAEVDAAVLAPSFHQHGLGPFGTDSALRLLPWSEDQGAFVGSLAPGRHSLLVRGAGLAEYREITLSPGAVQRLSLKPWRGIESTVFFELLLDPPSPEQGRSRGLQPAESMLLEVLTPTGSTTLAFPSKDQRRVEGGFEFTAWLPCTAIELRARTKVGPNMSPRAGRCVLEPGTLDASQGRPRVRIPLTNAPR